MLKNAVIIFLSLSVSACAGFDTPIPQSLIGKWIKVATPQNVQPPFKDMPSDCPISIELRSDFSLTSQSGELLINATYAVKSRWDGYLVKVWDVKNNGMPNCQGISAEYVMSHFQHYWYFESNGVDLHFYPSPENRNMYLLFKRNL